MDVLFQMRYSGLPNSNKQPNDSLRAEATPVFYLIPVLLTPIVLLTVFAELLWGLPERLYILDCHNAISYRRLSYYAAYER